jgi:hypothetical protein
MSHVRPRATLCRLVYSFPLTLVLFGLLVACASTPDQPEWIRIGVTTKEEVIAQYGQPDLVFTFPGGDTGVYRPVASVPRLEIPTAQIGPFGVPTTRMQTIEPGLGANDRSTEAKRSLRKEIRISYDARGVVQELSTP